jgi:serine protease AprX
LSVSPASQSVKVGQKAVYNITVTPLNGFTGAVSLGCVDQPQNSTCSFSSNPVVLTGSKSLSKVTVQTSRSTAPATYPLVFSGTLGNGVPQAGGILHYIGEYPNLIILTVK